MNEINKILKEFAETNNIDIIFSSNQMLIGKSKLDVSNDLLNIVNKQITNFKNKIMDNKLNKQDIINLLPHREPMLLIDELINIKIIFCYCHS